MNMSDEHLDELITALLRRRVDQGRPLDLEVVLREAMSSPPIPTRARFLTWPALGGLGAVITAVVVIALVTAVLRPTPGPGPAASLPASPEPTAPAIAVPVPTATASPSRPEPTTPPGASPTAAARRAARIDGLFGAYSANTPGCAVAIMAGNSVAYANGYGLADLTTKRPITPSSVFFTAAASGGIVATIVLELVADRQLDLGKEVHAYVPELPDYGLPVTVRELLYETSGIRDYFNGGLLTAAGFTEASYVQPADILRALSTEKTLQSTPGSRVVPNNSDYFLLSLIVERVTGQPFQTVAAERLFAPLGMASTFFRTDATSPVAGGVSDYAWESGTGTFTPSPFRWQTLGNGNLETSVLDLGRWAGTYLDDAFGDAALRATRVLPGRTPISNGLTSVPGMALDSSTPNQLLISGGATPGSVDEMTIDLTRHAAAAVACNVGPQLRPPSTQVILDTWFQGP